jgi:hypothetical protein
MKRYALKTQGGETIKTIKASCLIEACETFAEIKNLRLEDLKKIFIVELFDLK